MNQHPVVLVDPFYKWLDHVIAEHGHYLYMLTVWLSRLLIMWILKGGFWRKPPQSRRRVPPPPLPKRPMATPPPLPPSNLGREGKPSADDEDSFAA